MNKKNIFSILIIILLIMIAGCSIKYNDVVEDNNNDSNEVISFVNIVIEEKIYKIKLEDNETVRSFINVLPQELDMQELNGNEKYAYLDITLPVTPVNPERINIGDVMLYGNNCLVVFYKSFNTSYSYVKIGHIDNLPDLGKGNIKVKIEK